MTTRKLTDTQSSILNYAAAHPARRVLPLPPAISNKGGAGTRLLKSMLQRHLVQEEIAFPEDQEWSRNADGERFTLAISQKGIEALGQLQADVIPEGTADTPALPAADESTAPSVTTPVSIELRAGTKGAAIVALLQRDDGATISDLMAASDWQAYWLRLYGTEAPIHMSPEIIAQAIAYRLQERAFGGLSPHSRAKITSPRTPNTLRQVRIDRAVKSGTLFIREWQGRTVEVLANESGGYVYRGSIYKSLSAAASAITGTRWSGPAFFGLKEAKQRGRE